MFTKDDKLRSEMRHECELSQEEDIVVSYINSGWCVPLRRKMRRHLILSDTNNRSKVYLRSAYVIKKEKLMHLRYHYYMIHPFSNFRMVWEFFMMIVFTMLLILIPGRTIFKSASVVFVKVTLDIFCYMDIVINFNTGYQDMETTKVVMSRLAVSKRYLCTWFFIDFISSFNTDILAIFSVDITEQFNMVSYYMSYFKVFRVMTLTMYIERLRDYNQWSIYKFKVFKLFWTFMLTFWWILSWVHTFNLVRTGYHVEVTTFYILETAQKVVYLLLLFGSNDTKFYWPNALAEITSITMGFIIQLSIIAQILQIVTKYSLSGSKYYQMTQQLQEYMRYKNLPEYIRSRILTYFDFRFQHSYYKEEEILRILSPQLRQEMLVHTYMSLLEKVTIFDDIPMAIICKIIYNMKQEIYLPSDMIVMAGTVGDSMFFIASGTVAVYTSTGKEICHLSDGTNFGEIALIMENEQRVASVVAIDCCEVFILHRKDFLKQIDKYPDILNRVRKMAQDRLRKTMVATFGGDDSDEGMSDQVSFTMSNRQISGKYII